MMAARAGDPSAEYAFKGTELRTAKGEIKANYYCCEGDTTGIASHLKGYADVTAPVRSYQPNGFGLYNMTGNVAELVSDKNIVKGGSWKDKPEDLRISGSKPYKGPSATVGFRYVMIVHKD
jgi:formylglycine-generating enzyme required for sulfatase activity